MRSESVRKCVKRSKSVKIFEELKFIKLEKVLHKLRKFEKYGKVCPVDVLKAEKVF